MRLRTFVFLTVALCCLFTLTPSALFSQGSSTATVTGTVTDQKGAAVPNATVELLDVATNGTRVQTTNDTGYYIFVSVPPGSYKATIKKEGFRTASIGPLDVQVGKSFTVDARLEIGTMTQTVEVTTGAGIELQTSDSSVGNVLDRRVLDTMPTLARDATALLMLQPLATPGFNAVGSPGQGGEGDNTGGQVAGARSDQNTFMLDGGDATDSTAGSGQYSGTNFTATPRAVVPTPVESLEEFRVVTNNPTAGFARSSGGEVQMVTRSGGNAFHGAVYEYHNDQHLNANTWDRNSVGKPNPLLRDNRFGGRLGGPIWKGKTFFFVHYEGRRFTLLQDIKRRVPSDLLKTGILQFRDCSNSSGFDSSGNCIPGADGTTGPVIQYNLNGTTGCGPTNANACDPRTGPNGLPLGLNPTIAAVWALEPTGNQPTGSGGDGLNTLGFTGSVPTPIQEDFGVARLDHVINSKWQFTGTYRYDKTTATPTVQADIGGLLSGDVLGQPRSTALRPLAPRYVTAGLVGQITSHLTNDFHYDWLRHWWEWGTLHPTSIPAPEGGFAQPDGLNASLSIGGEGIGVGMQPINVDTQNARSRLWNGKDNNFFDNVSWIKGTHLFQFGGRAGRQDFFHRRDDKVVGGLTSPIFTVGRLATGSGITIPSADRPPLCNALLLTNCLNPTDLQRYRNAYAAALGMVDRAQQLKTRAPDFSPNADGTPLTQHTIVNSYQLYFTDSWKVKPSFTVNYGLTWGVQLPPFEKTGKQTMAVYDATGEVVTFDNYIEQRKSKALNGLIFNPQIDYVPIKQLGRKYPYDPDWTNFAPRASVAWNPYIREGFLGKFFGDRKTVLRGGFARVYDRINGVGIVMIPALGVGFGNNLRCRGPRIPDPITGVVTCRRGATPSNSFRIGTDGTVLPIPNLATIPSGQPLIPAVNSPFEVLDFRIDPKRQVGYANTFDVTLQRELPHNMVLEIGYVGNYAHRLYQGYSMSQVPYMMTLGGQSFAQAFSNIANVFRQNPGALVSSIPNQPFFETLDGGSANCGGSCTQLEVQNAINNGDGIDGFINANVTDFWEGLSFPDSVIAPGSVVGAASGGIDTTQVFDAYIIGSHGRSNYNAGFISLHKRTSAGLAFDVNYTLSHAFDQIGQNQESLNETSDAFKLDRDYGSAQFDRRHTVNALVTYDLPFGGGKQFSSSSGVVNKIIGGWNISGVYVFGSGLPLDVFNGNSCQEFGQGEVFGNCSAYIPINKKVYTSSVHNTSGSLNQFGNPAGVSALISNFRTPDIFLDGRAGRGFLRDLPRWNVDFAVSKTTKITERVSTRFDVQMTNVFNHLLLTNSNGNTDVSDPAAFGSLTGQYNQPRFIQFGLRFEF